jgi:hypothetical protein
MMTMGRTLPIAALFAAGFVAGIWGCNTGTDTDTGTGSESAT